MKKSILTLVIVSLILPLAALAQVTVNPTCTIVGGIPIPSAFCASVGPAGKKTVTDFVINVIQILLLVVGIIAILFLIIGGFRYVTAAGNEERSEAAKKTIQHAIVGIIIVILSFVIITVIAEALIRSRV